MTFLARLRQFWPTERPTSRPTASATDPDPSPTVFVRTISAPPGLPWDQARMADLEARSGAPLPMAELAYEVVRLEPWRPGRAARYLASYVRAREVGDRLRTTAQVDGRSVALEFVSQAERARRLRSLVVLSAATAITALFTIGATYSALSERAAGAERMASVNQAIETRARQVRAISDLKAQTRALRDAHVGGRSVADFLVDLAWASRAKAAGAHIDAIHWERGAMVVEARGDTAPFAQPDRSVFKDEKPLRPGVWPWAVAPAGMRLPPPAGAPR